jgi:hypothetical protein
MEYAVMNQKDMPHPNAEQKQETGRVHPFQAMGLNDNMDFLGTRLHIQTEKIGYPMPSIVTQVFSKGRIVLSKKSEYPAGDLDAGNPDNINEQMRLQHFQVIQDISDKQKSIQGNPKI